MTDDLATEGSHGALSAEGPLFKSLLQSSNDCIAILDLDGRIEHANPRALEMAGVSQAEVAGLCWRDLWPEEHKAEVDRAIEAAKGGETARLRAFQNEDSGTPSWWDTRIAPAPGDDGRTVRMVAVSRDVTQQIEAQSVLDTIIEYVPAVLFAKDARDGRYVLLNFAAQELFGRSRDEMIGRTDAELFPDAEATRLQEAEAKVVLSGKVSVEETAVSIVNSGLRYFRTRKMATYGDEGPRHLIGVAEDVTEERAAAAMLRAAAEQAEAANQAKSAFLANMSHEIRTPLNGVVGVADVLSRTALSADQRDMVELIRSSGVTLERLLSDVLDLARIESGKIDIQVEPFHLSEAVRGVVALLSMRAKDKGVALELEMPKAAEGHVQGDVVRVKQILTNLISNAIKFTEKGEVRLKAVYEGGPDQVFRFEVHDTGVGFDPSQKERVFARFQQADGSITRRFGGTGLGLAISRQLAELMGGSLDCDSTAGVGSVFTVVLPLAAAKAPEVLEPRLVPGRAGRAPGDDGRPLRILLADDHPINRKVVELILGQAGVDMLAVEDGRAALEAFQAGRFDAVLMDMQMPVMDGLAATAEIRRFEKRLGRTPTPVIMLTANALNEHIEASLKAGADRHLTKPIAADKLLSALAELAAGASADDKVSDVA